jgi:retinol dehydrogenase-12
VSIGTQNVSDLVGRYFGTVMRAIMRFAILSPPSKGALTPLYAGTAKENEHQGGKYFTAWARELTSSMDSRASDEAKQDEMIAWCNEQLKPFLTQE